MATKGSKTTRTLPDKLKGTIVEELYNAMGQSRLDVTKLAVELGIPRNRIYKWFNGSGFPKQADTPTIRAWIDKQNGKKLQRGVRSIGSIGEQAHPPLSAGAGQGDLLQLMDQKIIDFRKNIAELLQTQQTVHEQQLKSFLEQMQLQGKPFQEQIVANLGELLTRQKMLQSQVKCLQENEIRKAAVQRLQQEGLPKGKKKLVQYEHEERTRLNILQASILVSMLGLSVDKLLVGMSDTGQESS